jgi:hypothetical protein
VIGAGPARAHRRPDRSAQRLPAGSFFPSLLERQAADRSGAVRGGDGGLSARRFTRKVNDSVRALSADTGFSESEVSDLRRCRSRRFADRSLAEQAFPCVFLGATYCKAAAGCLHVRRAPARPRTNPRHGAHSDRPHPGAGSGGSSWRDRRQAPVMRTSRRPRHEPDPAGRGIRAVCAARLNRGLLVDGAPGRPLRVRPARRQDA